MKQELVYSGMLKKELATISGVHKRAIDTYVRTKASMPPADVAVKIAKALGVTVEYLVTGEEDGKPDKMLNHDIRSIIQILLELNKKDIATILSLAKVLKKQSEES